MYSLLTFWTNAIVSLYSYVILLCINSSPYDSIFYLQQMKRLAAL